MGERAPFPGRLTHFPAALLNQAFQWLEGLHAWTQPRPGIGRKFEVMVLSEQAEDALLEATGRYPGVQFKSEAVLAAVLAQVENTKDLPCAADFALSCAALEGDKAALSHLDRILTSSQVTSGLRSFEPQGVAVADVVQGLRHKLLVQHGTSPPRLKGYEGRAPLAAWLRAAGVRMAIDLRRSIRSGHGDVDALDLPADSSDPELLILRQTHGEQLSHALRDAFDSMTDRDVNVLRMYFIDGVTPEKIASVQGVNRTTVWRWILRAKEQWLAGARGRLMEQLQLDASQATSLIRGLRSGFHASLERWANERR